ncbi:MAG: hypothetical protein NDJ89_13230 [Oligoflexia bacterium]|nr:hypothetical protein [Oligoflexia bacterium]
MRADTANRMIWMALLLVLVPGSALAASGGCEDEIFDQEHAIRSAVFQEKVSLEAGLLPLLADRNARDTEICLGVGVHFQRLEDLSNRIAALSNLRYRCGAGDENLHRLAQELFLTYRQMTYFCGDGGPGSPVQPGNRPQLRAAIGRILAFLEKLAEYFAVAPGLGAKLSLDSFRPLDPAGPVSLNIR